jgi:Holliday junction DNA helicase RuvA
MVSTLISAITGTLRSKGPDYADVSVGGVTFRVSVPLNTLETLGDTGNTVSLLTSLQIRQDSITLYGFSTEEDRIAFETLINISGVGPRLAIAILSTLDAGSLSAAVQAEDTVAFTRVSGIGKRTASRIVLELKGKMDHVWSVPSGGESVDDVFDSLTALGYSIQETRDAISSVPSHEVLTTEEKLRHALQFLTSR